MDKFPPLTSWFRFLDKSELYDSTKSIVNWYYEHNECSFFTLLWKDGADKELFEKEFIKMISRIRWSYLIEVEGWTEIDFAAEFMNYIDTWRCKLTLEQKKDYINNVMAHWMRNKEWNFDLESTRGHIWEILYYLIRKQYLKDDHIDINPNVPKRYSKEPWLDFTEIRKDEDWFYLIIWEVKTTKNSIWSYPNKILNQLNENHNTTFLEHHSFYKNKLDTWVINDSDLEDFIIKLPNFSSISSLNFRSNKKRFTGVINYWKNIKHTNTVFWKFKTHTQDTLADEVKCRNVKLIWIANIDDIVIAVYGAIFVDFLK